MLSPCIIPLLFCILGLCGATISNVNDTEDKFYKYENNYYYCDEDSNWFVIEDKMQSIKKPKFLELTKFEEMYGLDYSCNSYFYINNQLHRYNGENDKWESYKKRQKEWETISFIL